MNYSMNLKHSLYGSVRVVITEGILLFSAADIARCLGYASPRDAVVRRIDPEETYRMPFPTGGGMQEMIFIEPRTALRFCMDSRKENAVGFAEALPSLVSEFELPTPITFTEAEDEEKPPFDDGDDDEWEELDGVIDELTCQLRILIDFIREYGESCHVSSAI